MMDSQLCEGLGKKVVDKEMIGTKAIRKDPNLDRQNRQKVYVDRAQ